MLKKVTNFLPFDNYNKSNNREQRYSSNQATGSRQLTLLFELLKCWKEIVGHFIAEHGLPFKLQSKILQVATSNPVICQSLAFMEKDILLKILLKFPQFSKKIEAVKIIVKPQWEIEKTLSEIKTIHEEEKPHFIISKLVLGPETMSTKLSSSKETMAAINSIQDEDLKILAKSLYQNLIN